VKIRSCFETQTILCLYNTPKPATLNGVFGAPLHEKYLIVSHFAIGILAYEIQMFASCLMLIENALFDAVRFFHIDALSSHEGLKVDFDMTLLVIASGLYRLIAERMRGYADAHAWQIFRDLIDMPADVTITDQEVSVSFHRRTHLPIIIASNLIEKRVKGPW
jgi:hypothetical protein